MENRVWALRSGRTVFLQSQNNKEYNQYLGYQPWKCVTEGELLVSLHVGITHTEICGSQDRLAVSVFSGKNWRDKFWASSEILDGESKPWLLGDLIFVLVEGGAKERETNKLRD